MRIYSNYTPNETDSVTNMAQELGFSLSAFQHYCVMLYVGDRGTGPALNVLIQTMFNNLKNKKSGDTFIVSSLLPDMWPRLSRSEKMTLAKQLSYYVKSNKTQYLPYKVTNGKTTIYKKL